MRNTMMIRMIIDNQDGIEMEHALATGTFPDFFDYPKFKVNNTEIEYKKMGKSIYFGMEDLEVIHH